MRLVVPNKTQDLIHKPCQLPFHRFCIPSRLLELKRDGPPFKSFLVKACEISLNEIVLSLYRLASN